jgi:hypothetical protein
MPEADHRLDERLALAGDQGVELPLRGRVGRRLAEQVQAVRDLVDQRDELVILRDRRRLLELLVEQDPLLGQILDQRRVADDPLRELLLLPLGERKLLIQGPGVV